MNELKSKAPIGLGSIDAPRVHELVYQSLTRALMAGQIRSGQKLSSRKLALELGTSDMPVRAALLRLQSLKALSQLPNGSLVLPPMTRERFSDLMNSRMVCEAAATELASANITKSEIKALRKGSLALNKAAKSQNIDDYLLANYEFKFQIYRASRSESLLFLIETLWLQVGPFLRQFAGRFDGDLSGIRELDYHEEVVGALERGDANAAAKAIRVDIGEGSRFLLEHGDFD